VPRVLVDANAAVQARRVQALVLVHAAFPVWRDDPTFPTTNPANLLLSILNIRCQRIMTMKLKNSKLKPDKMRKIGLLVILNNNIIHSSAIIINSYSINYFSLVFT